jgi:hypothetical protein
MPITRILIANRGEIAIRIARAAADLGLRSVAVHFPDDARSLHVRAADEVRELPGQGAAAYLDAGAIIAGGHGQRTRCSPSDPTTDSFPRSRLRAPLREGGPDLCRPCAGSG